MNRLVLGALVAALVLLPVFAAAHPPILDRHNSCVQQRGEQAERSPTTRVRGTLSYLWAFEELRCNPDQGDLAEWGSHAGPCPPLMVLPGPIPVTGGGYCGPIVLPGATATCTWVPLSSELERLGLVIGFDGLVLNGYVNLVMDGERPVFGPFPPGAWTVTNPYPVPARVIAFPTNTALPPDPLAGVLSPGDLHELVCVAP